MTAEDLRKSILQQAIQGKLVPQDPNDEPAAVLLERIREEKTRLIKEKKIKKDKNESIIFRGDDNSHYEKFADGTMKCIDEDIPFEIPNNWSWCRLGNVLTVKGGKRIPLGSSFAQGVTSHIYIRVTEMKNNTLMDKDLKYIDNSVFEAIKNYTISKNDLYLTIAGTIGSVGIVPDKFDGMNLTENAVKLTYIMCNKMFLLHLITSTFVQSQFVDKTKQVAQPKLAIERIQTTLIPLPPLSEQQRIVEKLEMILPLVEQYSDAQIQLETLNSEIKGHLKKSILQEAIQGKLVAQCDSDEPATDLLKRVQEEKLNLLKQGKLKKKDIQDSNIFRADDNRYYEKIGNEMVCIDEELPFEIPHTWTWVNIGSLFYIQTGAAFKKEQANTMSKGVRILRGGNISPDHYSFKDDDIFINESLVDKSILLQKNDLITPAVTSLENIGKIARVLEDYNDVSAGGFVFILRPHLNNDVYSQYLCAAIQSPYLTNKIKQITKKSGSAFYNIGKERLVKLYLPLPPLTEQARIVNALNRVLKSIEG